MISTTPRSLSKDDFTPLFLAATRVRERLLKHLAQSRSLSNPGICAQYISNPLPQYMPQHLLTEPKSLEVKVNLHACAINEIREPFELTPMHLPNGSNNKLLQVWFPGTHGDIGWETETGLSEAPLAWMIQQLQTLVGIQFDEGALKARFPAYGAPADKILAPKWLRSQTHQPSCAVLPFVGRKARVPGAYSRPEMATNERIHISARLRSGSLPFEKAIPGYRVHLDADGTHYWIRKPASGFWQLGSTPAIPSITQTRIREAALGELESALLGLLADEH
jgi:hypothetical protein